MQTFSQIVLLPLSLCRNFIRLQGNISDESVYGWATLRKALDSLILIQLTLVRPLCDCHNLQGKSMPIVCSHSSCIDRE